MTADGPVTPLVGDRLVELLALLDRVDSVELKATIAEEQRRSTVDALGMDPLEGTLRQVWFFDTPDLALERAGVVVRGRRSQGRQDDTVVKLRPVAPAALPAELRASPDFVVEVDVLPGGFVCSGSLRGHDRGDRVRQVLRGERPVHGLFTPAQRDLYALHAPAGLAMDDLLPLGPVNVLKLRFTPDGLARRLVAELWLYPDGSRILELSTRCAPHEAVAVAVETRGYLASRGIDLSGHQRTKTRTALELFAGQARGTA